MAEFRLTQTGVASGFVLGAGVGIAMLVATDSVPLALAVGFGLGAGFAVVFSATQDDETQGDD